MLWHILLLFTGLIALLSMTIGLIVMVLQQQKQISFLSSELINLYSIVQYKK